VPFTGGSLLNSAYSGATHTWSNLIGGNFPAGSKVVAFVFTTDAVTMGISPSVSGNAMTKCAGNRLGGASSQMECWYLDLGPALVDSITMGNNSQFSYYGLVGMYLTGAATGGPSVTSEQQFGVLVTPQTLALMPPSGGIGLWGFVSHTSSFVNAVPVWANVAASVSDEYVLLSGLSDFACNHAVGTGSSITAQVTPTGGGNNYNFASGLLAAGWAVAGAAGPARRTSIYPSPYLPWLIN
jgi:hypothetical protein